MGKWYRNNQIIYVETIKGQQRMPYPQQNFPQGQPGMGQNRMRKYFNFSLGTLPLIYSFSTTTKWNAWTKPKYSRWSKWDASKYG